MITARRPRRDRWQEWSCPGGEHRLGITASASGGLHQIALGFQGGGLHPEQQIDAVVAIPFATIERQRLRRDAVQTLAQTDAVVSRMRFIADDADAALAMQTVDDELTTEPPRDHAATNHHQAITCRHADLRRRHCTAHANNNAKDLRRRGDNTAENRCIIDAFIGRVMQQFQSP